ncbi:MAG: glucuronoarabinoxylan endo-1,4-beta-xylanase, partial [bacterium]
ACMSMCTHIITARPSSGFACPHTIGFWRQQCAQRGNGSTKVCLDGMLNLWRCVITETDVVQWKTDGGFETTASLAALPNATLFDRLCSQLQGPRPMTLLDMAEIQYLGLMLNVCSGALPLDIEISNGFNGTVAEAIDAIENALNTGEDIGYWKDVADNINNRIGVLAAACPDEDEFFQNLPGCEDPAAPGSLGLPGFGDLETMATRPFPNPVTANATSIEYVIPSRLGSAAVRITIFDVTGRVLRTLAPGSQSAGQHAVDWDLRDDDGSSVTSGIYFYRLSVGDESITEKLMIVRN